MIRPITEHQNFFCYSAFCSIFNWFGPLRPSKYLLSNNSIPIYLQSVISKDVKSMCCEQIQRILWRHTGIAIINISHQTKKTLFARNQFSNWNRNRPMISVRLEWTEHSFEIRRSRTQDSLVRWHQRVFYNKGKAKY